MEIDTHTTLSQQFLSISNTNRLIVIDYYWLLLILSIIGNHWLTTPRIKEFRSLLLASLSSQELWITGSCVKRVCGSLQVGESLSLSQHYTVKRKQVNRESGRLCLFLEGDQHHNKIPLNTFRPVASKNNTTALDYSAFHNFKKLEPFINAGLGLVFQKMSKIYSWIVLERNCVQMFFFSWWIIVSIFFFWFGNSAINYGKANNWFLLFFAGSNL